MLIKSAIKLSVAGVCVAAAIFAVLACVRQQKEVVNTAKTILVVTRAERALVLQSLAKKGQGRVRQSDINRFLTNNITFGDTMESYLIEYATRLPTALAALEQDICRLASPSKFKPWHIYSIVNPCPESIQSIAAFFPEYSGFGTQEAIISVAKIGQVQMIDDYRGVKVFSTSQPLHLNDREYALVVEADHLEVMRPVYVYRFIVLSILAGLIVIVIALSRYILDRHEEVEEARAKEMDALEQKRLTEEAAKEEQEKINAILNAAFSSSLEGISLFTDKDFICFKANDRFLELNGKDDPIGQKLQDLVPKAVEELHKNHNYLRANAHKVMGIQNRRISIDETGRTTTLSVNDFFINTKRYWIVTQADLTEQVIAEEQMAQLRKMFIDHQQNMLQIKQGASYG